MMKAFKILFLALFALVSTQSAGQQQLFLNQTGGAPPTAGLLDQYKGAAFAAAPDVLLYSTYSATDDIAGSLTNGQVGQWSVAVFRDFDDAIKSFTPAEVADGTANTWVQELGPSYGFVRRWYDQSVTALDVSNLNHADQSDPTRMPKLFDSATGLILENGKAAMDFDGTDDYLFNTSLTIAGGEDAPMSSLVVGTSNNVTTTQRLYGFGRSGSDNALTDLLIIASNIYYRKRSDNGTLKSTNGSTTLVNNTQYLFSTFTAGTTVDLYLNSESEISAGDIDVPNLTINQFGIGVLLFGSNAAGYMNGTIQTLIIYPSDQSTNRPGIENKINQEYQIY